MRNLKKILKIIYMLSLGSMSLFINTQLISQINVGTDYPIESVTYIKKIIKPGKISVIKADILQRVLIGEWDSLPPFGVVFKNDGTFKFINFEYGKKVEYQGLWKVKDNIIEFKVDGAAGWQECKIIYVKYKTCGDPCPKDASFREYLSIKLEEVYFETQWRKAPFLLGGISISFN